MNNTFGENLSRARLQQQLSCRELATRAGVCYTQIYAYEQGRAEPKLSNAVALADALGKDVYRLLESPRVGITFGSK